MECKGSLLTFLNQKWMKGIHQSNYFKLKDLEDTR